MPSIIHYGDDELKRLDGVKVEVADRRSTRLRVKKRVQGR